MTEWAEKVLEGVPTVCTYDNHTPPRETIWRDDALAAIARMGAGDGLVERLLRVSIDMGDIPSTTTLPSEVIREAAAHITALTEQNQTWQRNSRETFDAMVAMRNSINEHLPMPSLESDLLQGPENSVFCAAVADAVVQHVAALTAQVAELEACLERQVSGHREDLDEIANVSVQRLRRAEAAEAERDALRAKVARLEAAVMWARYRIAVDSGMTKAETKRTADELLNVLRGKPSPASDYAPEKWQFPTRAAVTDGGKDE